MNLLFQLWIGDPVNNPVLRPSRESMKRYAARMGADYKFFTHHIWDDTFLPQFQCLWMFEEEQDEYDTIVFADADICVRIGVTDNIFEDEGHALNFAYRDAYRSWHKKAKVRSPQIPCDESIPGFNGGIYKFTREERQQLRPHINEAKELCRPGCFHDEMLLNVAMSRASFEPKIIAEKWNWCFEYPQFPGRDIRNGNFIHIMHDKKNLYKMLKKKRIVQ